MAGSQTLRFDIVGDASGASRAFRETADNAALAARGARQFSDSLAVQSRSARASADATLALAKSDSILRDAQLTLAGATDDASGSLGTLRRRLDELQGKVAAARVNLEGDKEAQARLDAISARLADLDHKTSTPSLDIQGVARATAELSAVDVALDKVGAKGGSAAGAASSLGLLASPMAALVGAGVALSPVLVTTGFGMAGLGAAAAKTVAPILQAGTATKKQQEALASLDPAQRAAYNSLTSLKGEFGSFSKSLEPEVLGIFNKGLSLTSGLMHDVQPVAAATGKALDTVLGRVDAEFRSQNWQNFFGFMAKTAAPDVQLLGQLIVDLTADLPPLLEDLQPLAVDLIQVADGAAKAVGAIAQLPSDLSKAQAATNDYLSGLEKHIPAGNKNIFQVLGDGLGWLEKHIPAGNKSLLDLASSSDSAAASVKKTGDGVAKTGDSAAQAAPKVGTLAGDVALLDTSTTNAATALSAYNDAWAKILGNSLSDQQAILADEAAFNSLTTSVKNSGGESLQARQAFVSYMQQIGTSISTLQQNGASVSQVNAEYERNIKWLQGLHNLTPQQRADIQGLIRDYDTWATSTAGLNRQTLTAAQTIRDKFTADLKALHEDTPTVNADVNNFANSVLKTGTNSNATRQYRAQLISDLHDSGMTAQDATKLVDGYQKKIDALHGKTVPLGVDKTQAERDVNTLQEKVHHMTGTIVPVTVNAAGSGGVSVSATGLAARVFKLSHLASGGVITTGTGPTADDVPILVSKGETVVSAATSKKLAPVFAAHKVPGYAAGGLVDAPNWSASQAGDIIGSWAGSSVQSMLNAMISQYQAAAAKAAAPAAGASGGIIAAMMKNMAAARGWTGAQWNALYAIEQREAGFNMTARNPSSGAYGLAQFINGPSEYAQYGGSATTAQGQITGMLNYIAQRYGNPANAWAHEVAYGWYDKGGMLKPGFTLAYNGTGRPEQVVPAGRGGGGGDVHVHLHNEGVIGSQHELQRWLLESTRELTRTRGGGNVQTAFGRN